MNSKHMVVVLKKDAGKDEIAALEQTLYSKDTNAGFDARKYNSNMSSLPSQAAPAQKMEHAFRIVPDISAASATMMQVR